MPDRFTAGVFIPLAVGLVAFGESYEGMLPVRSLTSESGEREWWELNEEGTILRGQHTDSALRLGDAVRVRVERVDAPRGRVDLVRELARGGS